MRRRLPIEFAAFQAHLALGHAERLGQEGQQMGVGLAIDRRGGETDLQPLTMQPGELVLARLGLQATVEDQVLAVPAKVAHAIKGLSLIHI